MLGGHFTKPLKCALFRKFRVEIMNILDDLDMGKMGMDGACMEKGVMWKLHNDTNPGFPKECVGDYENVREINGAVGASDRKASANSNVRSDTCNSLIICKIERSREAVDVVRMYADVARGNIGRTLEQ